MGIYDDLDKYTGPALLQSALNVVTANVDKREGSVIWDTLSPLSVMEAGVIKMLKTVLENTNIQTASGSWLDLVASQPPCGLYRKQAIKARKFASYTPFDYQMQDNTTYTSNNGLGLIWRVISAPDSVVLNPGQVIVECDTPGAEPAGDYGTLQPVAPDNDLKTFEFDDVPAINEGANAESDLEFRLRIWESLKSNRYGGNFDDYLEWCLTSFRDDPNGASLDGMQFYPSTRYIGGGNILIYPTTTGANGFKYYPASAEICSFLKAFIDPEPLTGYGAGVAPVGHRVSIQQRNVDSFALHVVVTLKEGSELTPEIVASARHSLEGYFEELRAALVSQKGDTFPNDPGSIAGYRTVLYKQRVLEAVRIGGNFEAATNVYRVSGTGYEFELPEEYIIDLSYSPQSGGLPVLADSFEITTGGMG